MIMDDGTLQIERPKQNTIVTFPTKLDKKCSFTRESLQLSQKMSIIIKIVITLVTIGLVTFAFVSTILHRRNPVIAQSFTFSFLFCIGSYVALLLNLIFLQFPNENSICISRMWITNLTLVYLFGVIISKSFIFYKMIKNHDLTKLKHQNIYIVVIIGGAMIIDILYCCIWTFVDPPMY